jgi:cold shock CspA family protein
MNTGIIQPKKPGKDFAFIKVEGQQGDTFFHRSGVTDPVGFDGLMDGDKVTFEIEEKDGRKNAVNVMKAA